MKLFGSIKELVSTVFRKDTYEVTLRPNQSTTYTAARDIQLPAKDGNAVLVSSGDIVNNDINASAAIAYSKLALSNSIVNADVSSTAAIDASKIGGGLVSNTEFSYLDGVTSSLQTQINSKQATITGAATTITSADLTASKALQSDASGKVSVSTVTSTELGYVSGVTSAIQTQLGNKASSGANSDITSLSGLTTPLSSGQGGTGINNGGTLTYGANNISLTTSGATSLTLPTTGTVTTTSNKLSAFASTSSSELAGVISDETGSGSLVFGTSPTLSSPQVNSSLVVQQIATPSNPSAGFDKLYTKSDGILYKLDSAGNEVAVGSGAGGSGEINTVTNPSAATDTTGWAAGTSHSVSKDTSNSPLNPVVPTSFGISSSAAVTLGAQTSTSGVYDAITMPSGLQNRKLKVEFFFTTPASSSGTWAVAVYQGSTKVALSTDSSGDTILPAGVTGGKFTAYFDTISAASYSVNLVQRTRSLSNALYITNVVCGPGIQPQGAVVGEWVTFTGSITDSTGANIKSASPTQDSGRYRRVGTSMEIEYTYRHAATAGSAGTGTYRFNLPSGFTFNSSDLPPGTPNFGTVVGNGQANSAGGATDKQSLYAWVPVGATNYISLTATGGAQFDLSSTGFSFASTFRELSYRTSVPIAEWSGSGTVQLAQNDVEYASNDGTNNIYGPAGAAMPTTTTTSVGRTVTFQTPIQQGDIITVEWLNSLSGQWLPNVTAARVLPRQWDTYNPASDLGWGEVRQTSSTQVEVQFRRYRTGTTNWAGSTDGYWRVRKSSAGAAVGFGIVRPGVSSGLVSASGLTGNTTGNAIASGFVGEKITGTRRTLSTVGLAYATGSTSCITLNKGVYLMFVKGDWAGNNTASIIGFGVSSTPTTRTPVDSIFGESSPGSYNGAVAANAVTTTVDSSIYLAPPFYLVVSADSTQYYPTVYAEDQTGLSVGVNMAAVRIA